MYLRLSIYSTHSEAFEILIAELSEQGFEGFVEDSFEPGAEFYASHAANSPNVEAAKAALHKGATASLQAFIPENLLDKAAAEEVLQRYKTAFKLSWKYEEVKDENWNAIWESGFEPVEISNKLRIRALFHEPDLAFPMEIIIQPRMSFGTGHHATTTMICEYLLEMDLKNKNVFDFGTGTGILAILALKLGAGKVGAVDNDPQCVENAAENFKMNDTNNIILLAGDINVIEDSGFNVMIGNITRNVILQYFPAIGNKIAANGLFICSGFYETDLEALKSEAYSLGLQLESHKVKEGWCAASFRKQ
jgi:ribosomal protein L11 methyltransferase